MTPDERQLITGLFDRMRDFRLPEKDRDAESLINQAVRAMPEAPYMLVQSVLVQEQALEAANGRVQELEQRLRSLEAGSEQPQQGSGSFLGGLFGAPKPAGAQRWGSVPAVGPRTGSQASEAPAAPQALQQPAASGGFMRSALSTAAGVAGGMLAAEGIRNMMGTGSAHATPSAATTEAKKAEQVDDDPDNDDDDDDDNVSDADDGDGGDGDGGLDV